jgi:hypothetical protein
VTPPCAFRSSLIFLTPVRRATGLTRYLGQNRPTHEIVLAFYAHSASTIHGGCVTPLCFSELFYFLTPARLATGLTRRETVPIAKLAYAWNFTGLLFTLVPINTL